MQHGSSGLNRRHELDWRKIYLCHTSELLLLLCEFEAQCFLSTVNRAQLENVAVFKGSYGKGPGSGVGNNPGTSAAIKRNDPADICDQELRQANGK